MWEVIGWIGSGIIVYSMMQPRITRLRLFSLIGSLVSLAYAVAIAAWPLAALNGVLSLIQAYHLTRLWRTRHDAAEYRAIVAAPGDEIVSHVLDFHAAEIKALFPNFVRQEDSDKAFLTVAGNTIVGVMLVSINGNEGQLDLDFVTPEFRDLTPAEFVFRRSHIWRDAGVTRVRARVGGPEYYEKFGFTRSGDWCSLDL